eukprot:TRINITY_DN3469_c0_g1_i2.p1 TRINITY_DN3469_c0_g1~~TRINITY_DN3469_c0_g1_i2.p1  ORF type:complete len:466 (+),score=93.10 TRINITY_DN3469_c0_g1_i2:195-1400(+)
MTMRDIEAIKLKKKQQKKEKKAKGRISFDMSRYSTRHMALKIAYIGWDYHGFASQATVEKTIEGHVFAALMKTCLITSRETSNYTRCGRTDKGVSAFGQVIGIHLRSNLTQGVGVVNPKEEEAVEVVPSDLNNNLSHPSSSSSSTSTSSTPSKRNRNNQKTNNNDKNNSIEKSKTEIQYAAMLNRVLPPEIRVIASSPVPLHFNARFSALYRTYKYFFIADQYNLSLMSEAGQSFVGEHDFRNFCKMDIDNVVNYKRVVLGLTVEREGSLGVITISGFAFLWHQVRCMVSVLFMVGRGLEPVSIISDMLNLQKTPSKPMYEMASELPLVLYDCGFEDVQWEYDPEAHKKLLEHFHGLVDSLSLKRAVCDLMLRGIKLGGGRFFFLYFCSLFLFYLFIIKCN